MFDEQQVNRQLDETREVRKRFVEPVYLSLLHANFTRQFDDTLATPRLIAELANAISDDQISILLKIPDWRCRLTVGWYVGLTKRYDFVHEIGKLLLESEQVYAGQGYCVALGLIGDERCKGYLCDYLRKYLPMRKEFDQPWAIGALASCDSEMAAEFLNPAQWHKENADWDIIPSVVSLKFVGEMFVILSGVWRAFLRQTQSKDPEEADPCSTLQAFSATNSVTNF